MRPGDLQQGTHRWKYPSVDELVDACKRVDEVADQLGRLVEAYVVGGEEIHVHVEFVAGGERHGVCVSFVGFRYPCALGRTFKDFLPSSVYELGGDDPCEQIQAAMLVPITQDVQGVQGVSKGIDDWYSVERLQLLERCLRARGRTLEIPFDAAPGIFLPPLIDGAQFVRFDAVDRELACLVFLLAGATDQGGNEVVERSAGVVNEITDEQRPSRVDGFQRYVEDVLASVSINFSGDGLEINVGGVFDRFPNSLEVEHRAAPLEFVVPQEPTHDA